MRIYDRIVEPGREDHIARHHVGVEEVEEVVFAQPFVRRDKHGYLRLIGQTEAGCYLAVFVARRAPGVYRLVTARDATEAERRAYQRHRRHSPTMTTAEQEKPESKRAKSRIPRFKTIEEAAEWFDTHDTADYEDEFEEVTEDIRFVVTGGEPKKPMTVRLGQTDLAALTKQAQKLGVGPSTLARMWILEHLRETTTKATSSDRT